MKGDDEKDLGHRIAGAIKLGLEDRTRQTGLRMSKLGATCNRQLWYGNDPTKWDDAEPLTPASRLKFTYGHILEDTLLFLVEKSGHVVEQRQVTVDYHGVPGG